VAKNSTTKKPKEPTGIDEDGFTLVTGKNAARRPQQQIQPQQAARDQPTTQYDVLSSDEDDKDEDSKSNEDDKDEESKSKEEDNNRKEAPRTQQPRLTRELRALDITQVSNEKSEEPRPTRSKMTRELRPQLPLHPAILKDHQEQYTRL
jgi:hypothetical protein